MSLLLPLLSFLYLWVLIPSSSSSITPPSVRDPLTWPFADNSIWNLPIGKDAVYVPATIAPTGTYIFYTDQDVILLHPTAPITTYYYNPAGWTGASRCTATNNKMFTAPFPSDFIIPSYGNMAGAILMPDKRTIRQSQPLCHCTVSGNVTTITNNVDVDIYGDGRFGSHGGSGLSSIGGTLRLVDLMPDSVVSPPRHVLKGNLFAHLNYYRKGNDRSSCYRWPAGWCDGYYDQGDLIYNGTNPAVRPGSLLALNGTVDIEKLGLETEPGRQLAWTMQNYGMYLVDDTASNIYCLESELSPEGDFATKFQSSWGFGFTWKSTFTQDVIKIWANLYVVDNWDANTYATVSASKGSQGAGGGAPRQPWAPPFSTTTLT